MPPLTSALGEANACGRRSAPSSGRSRPPRCRSGSMRPRPAESKRRRSWNAIVRRHRSTPKSPNRSRQAKCERGGWRSR
jgi:hypothetical protein